MAPSRNAREVCPAVVGGGGGGGDGATLDERGGVVVEEWHREYMTWKDGLEKGISREQLGVYLRDW